MIRLEAVEASVPAAAAGGPPRQILRDLNAEFRPGESHLILGPNGSGKTTLIRLLAGLTTPSSGRVLLDGAPIGWDKNAPSLWPRVAVVFEEPDPQFLTDSVEAEVAFGLESLALPPNEIRERTADSLEAYGLAGFERRAPYTLSAGEKARTLLAAMMAARPRVLLLDQALAHLDPGVRPTLERRLVEAAMSDRYALICMHQDAEALHLSEHLHVLEDGGLVDAARMSPEALLDAKDVPFPLAMRVSALLATRGVWSGPLATHSISLALGLGAGHSCVGAASWEESPPWQGVPMKASASRPPRSSGNPQMVLAFQNVAYAPRGAGARGPLVAGISFELREGEVAALVGASGSGKSTILKIAADLLAPTTGSIHRAEPWAGRGRPTGLALEYPERQLFGRTVEEDVTAVLWVDGVPATERRARGREALEAVGLDPDRFGLRVPMSLSEGEKRRVAIAALLAEPPRALLLDEPTAGLDPAGRRALATVLRTLSARGHAVLLASHDHDFVSAVADRVILLGREGEGPGTVLGEGPATAIWRDPRLLKRAALPAPDFIWAEWALRGAGILGPDQVRDAESLLEVLSRSHADGHATCQPG